VHGAIHIVVRVARPYGVRLGAQDGLASLDVSFIDSLQELGRATAKLKYLLGYELFFLVHVATW